MTVIVTSRGIVFFALRVLGLGVVFFALWHFAHRPLSAITGLAAARVTAMPASVEQATTRQQGRALVFDVEPAYETSRRHRLAPGSLFEVSTNPLKYTFGLPFFLALLFASRPAGLLWKALAGSAVVIGLAAVGLACDVLIQVGSLRGPAGEALFEMPAREAIALGFQMGTLIFPTVVPAMLWAAMDPGTLRQFATIDSRAAPG